MFPFHLYLYTIPNLIYCHVHVHVMFQHSGSEIDFHDA